MWKLLLWSDQFCYCWLGENSVMLLSNGVFVMRSLWVQCRFLNSGEDISCLNWQLWQYLTCMQLCIVDCKDKRGIVGDPTLCLHLQSMASDYKVIHSATFHYHLRLVDSFKFTAESQPMTFILYPLWPSCIMHSQDAQLCAFLLQEDCRQHS